MSPESWQTLSEELARVFLGWKLREDYDALLAIGEGSLRLDLLRAEAWCDGEPLPSLFIAQELRSQLELQLSRSERTPPTIEEAWLDAEFHTQSQWRPDGAVPFLEIACRVRLKVAGREIVAQASTRRSDDPQTGGRFG